MTTRRAARSLRILLAALLGSAAFIAASPAAYAAVAVTVTPLFPATVAIGQTNVVASLQIQNSSSPPDGGVTLNTITLVPSCGRSGPTGCAIPDPGVFTLSPTGTGAAGTACAGRLFTITVVDPATGMVLLIPLGPPVFLPPGASCRIDFTLTVANAPSVDSNPGLPGLQTDQVGSAAAGGSSGNGTSSVTVQRAQPTLVTTASAPVTLGGSISDSAVIAAGVNPTGTIMFALFGPDNAAGTGTPVFTSTVPIRGNGSYVSGGFTPGAAGTYRYVAFYSGDANNAAVTSAFPGTRTSITKRDVRSARVAI